MNIIIDAPSTYESDQEWKDFLQEMLDARGKFTDDVTVQGIDRMIALAKKELSRRKAKTSSYVKRIRSHRKAKKLLGIKKDAQDRYDFMSQCIGEMMDEGSDPEEARAVCELLYEEGQDFEGDY